MTYVFLASLSNGALSLFAFSSCLVLAASLWVSFFNALPCSSTPEIGVDWMQVFCVFFLTEEIEVHSKESSTRYYTHMKSLFITVRLSCISPCRYSCMVRTSPHWLHWSSRPLMNGSLVMVEESPMRAKCLLALVTATLVRRCSFRNPHSPS